MKFMGGSASWPDRRIIDLFGITHPIGLAPMAGGPSTPDLAVAVAEGGGLGSLASATSTPDQVRRDMGVIRQRTARQIGRHTSELQSLMRISYAVFCLKKKKNYQQQVNHTLWSIFVITTT